MQIRTIKSTLETRDDANPVIAVSYTHLDVYKRQEQCVGGYERLNYDSRNLVTLCRDCHNAMHNRTDDTLTERGETLLRRSGVLRLGKNPPQVE